MNSTIVPIVTAIIGALATIITAWLQTRTKKQKKGTVQAEPAETPKAIPVVATDKVVRIASITAAGATVTMLVILMLAILNVFEPTREQKQLRLRDFPMSKSEIEDPLEKLKKRDEDAKALLEGSGSKQVTVGNRTWAVGDFVYAKELLWVQLVYPKSDRPTHKDDEFSSHDISDYAIPRGAKLTIKGFDKAQMALVEFIEPISRSELKYLEYRKGLESFQVMNSPKMYFFYPL